MRYMYVYLLSQKNGDGIKLKRAPAVPSGRVARVGRVGAALVRFRLLWLVRSAARRDRMLFSGSFSILDIIHHLSCVVLISLNQTNKSLSICACVCSVVRTGVYRGRLAPWGSPYCNVSQPHESRSRSYG